MLIEIKKFETDYKGNL